MKMLFELKSMRRGEKKTKTIKTLNCEYPFSRETVVSRWCMLVSELPASSINFHLLFHSYSHLTKNKKKQTITQKGER